MEKLPSISKQNQREHAMKTRNPFKKAVEVLNQHLKATTLENEFIPNNGVRHGDLKRYWDNYNAALVNRISEIRSYEKL